VKVCYVHHCSAVSGALISLLQLVRHLKLLGVSELVLAPAGPSLRRIQDEGFNCGVIGEPSMFASGAGAPLRGFGLLRLVRTVLRFNASRSLETWLDRFQPDLVHLNERGLFQSAKVAMKKGLPIVFHARNVADRDVRWAHELSISLLNRYAAAVIAIDGSVADSLREFPRVSIVYNSITGWKPSSLQPRKADAPVKVLLLCNLIPQKGIWDLLHAANILRDLPKTEFLIAGENPRPENFYRSLPGRIAGIMGLAPNMRKQIVDFLEAEKLTNVKLLGRVEDVRTLLEEVDINVFPSHLDGPSRSVFEAGLLSVPTVIALRNRVEDVVRDGMNGLIVPEKSPQALAAAIRRLVTDREFRERLGRQAANDFRTQFDPMLNASKTMKVYHDVLLGSASLPRGSAAVEVLR
jgi:glycosyltransferase involved in cell wall biosynthesis